MSDYDIHSCGYYCDRHACIVAQRNELRDKLFSNQATETHEPDGLSAKAAQREWQQLNAEDIKDIEGWVEFKEAGDNGPVPLGKLVLYISHKLREKNT